MDHEEAGRVVFPADQRSEVSAAASGGQAAGRRAGYDDRPEPWAIRDRASVVVQLLDDQRYSH